MGSNSANSTVSLNGNRLQNVGTGTEGTDAVNLNQLNSLTTTSSSQLTSLQSQVTGLQSQIYVNERGIAGVSAIANVPSLFVGQKFNVGLGFGAFNANTALAVADYGVLLSLGKVVANLPAAELKADASLRAAYLGY